MSGAGAPLEEIAAFFISLSLVAFGGVGAVLPEIHRHAVEVKGWLTTRDFAELYAIAQVAPGPNILIVTLVGLRAGGIAGALVATVATIAPAAALVYGLSRLWDRFRGSSWRATVQMALAPITAGLLSAATFLLVRTVDRSLGAVAITLAVVVVTTRTRIHPLIVFAAAAALGATGLV